MVGHRGAGRPHPGGMTAPTSVVLPRFSTAATCTTNHGGTRRSEGAARRTGCEDRAGGRAPGAAQPSGGAGMTVAEPVTAVPEPDVLPAPIVAAPTTAEVLTTLSGRADVLSRLGAARDVGMLTDEEFRQEKGRVMAL